MLSRTTSDLIGGPWSAAEMAAPKALRLIDAVANPVVHVALATTLIAVGIATSLRYRRGRRALKDRDRIQLLPSTSFDPNPESILRFAAQLIRTRRTLNLLTPRRALGVRIRLATHTGQLQYQLHGPRRAGSLLRHGTYPEVEIRRIDDDGTPLNAATGADPQPSTATTSVPNSSGFGKGQSVHRGPEFGPPGPDRD